MIHDPFQSAHNFVTPWEGGFVNNPSDPGGMTNFGVSLRFLREQGIDVNGDGFIDGGDIRDLTPSTARQILKDVFWDAVGLDALSVLPAIVLYDGGVNQGVRRAVLQMQAACNRFGSPPWIKADGVLGLRTRERIAQFKAVGDQLSLCLAALQERDEFYYRVVTMKPPSKIFLKGWLRRTEALRTYLREMSRELLK